jgi:hypothetical protein
VGFIVVVKNFFKDVEYPRDKESIKHIINEYDKVLEYKLYGDKITKKQMFFSQFFCIVILLYILKCSWVSIEVRSIYIIPLVVCLIYNFILFRRVSITGFEDRKLYYRFNISTFILISFFIYCATFMYQTIVFTKWDDKNYLICFGIVLLFSIITSIVNRVLAPKRFINAFLYRNNKLAPVNVIAVAIIELLIVIVYFNKPTFILLITSYFVVIFCFSCIAPMCFEYHQYDKIQELKKEINYIPNHKKR